MSTTIRLRARRAGTAFAALTALPLFGACVTTVPVSPPNRADAAVTDVPLRAPDGRVTTVRPVDSGVRVPDVIRSRCPPPADAGSADVLTLPLAPPTTGATAPERPISGGTLAVSADDTLAIASDPDRDQVWFVELASRRVASLALSPGDEPGRIAEDVSRRVHVVLRSAGAIADIDLATRTLIARRPVCAAPRGIVYDPDDDTLRVACVDGSLVTLPAGGGAPTRTIALPDDLRDVVYDATNHRLVVSRFRAATAIVVDPQDGAVISTMRPEPFVGMPRTMDPDVAWRMVGRPDGSVLMLHQYAASDMICPGGGGYGGIVPAVVPAASSLALGEARRLLTPFELSGRFATAVDIALNRATGVIAMAVAGTIPGDVRPSVIAWMPGAGLSSATLPSGQAVAVAYTAAGALLVQTRSPANLYLDAIGARTQVPLGAALPPTTGHQIFHAATGGGLSCAGCHPEGGDDGHTWNFGDVGPRRTQTLRGGIGATAPFHWDGLFRDIPSLLADVFHGRMSGPLLTSEQGTALLNWMDTIPVVRQPPPRDPSAVERGRALFNDPTVLCATCHSGPRFTNNATVDVGTGEPLQVPILTGIAQRAPYMHNGCAPDLRARFTDTACGGGDRHGRTSQLSSGQIDDLIAYLQTL